ncbi:hypothetical protein BH24ACI4_BH24ACI4_25690 [soil metagenome]
MPETQLARAATMHPFLRYQNAQAAVEWLVRAFTTLNRGPFTLVQTGRWSTPNWGGVAAS